jgi:DNA-binding NarL/FixJ family response regulator
MEEQQKLQIFLVEDKEMYAMMLDHKLKEDLVDHNLHIFGSGEECIERMETLNPDIVILDYLLPGMNGLETLDKIKKTSPETAVIVLSIQQNLQVARDVLKNGAEDYIVKNKGAIERLYHAINKIVERRELEDRMVTLQVRLNKNKIFMVIMGIIIAALTLLILAMIIRTYSY